MKPKEYLLQHGKIAAIGRGRISRENHAFLAEAVKKGASIEGYGDSPSTPAKSTRGRGKVVKPAPDAGVVELAPYRFPEDQFVAYEAGPRKRVERSLRSACFTCSVSLVVHICEDPRIVARDGRGFVPVVIERR